MYHMHHRSGRLDKTRDYERIRNELLAPSRFKRRAIGISRYETRESASNALLSIESCVFLLETKLHQHLRNSIDVFTRARFSE